MSTNPSKGRHRPGPGRPSPADLGAQAPSRHERTVPMVEIYGRLEFDRIVAEIDRRIGGVL